MSVTDFADLDLSIPSYTILALGFNEAGERRCSHLTILGAWVENGDWLRQSDPPMVEIIASMVEPLDVRDVEWVVVRGDGWAEHQAWMAGP